MRPSITKLSEFYPESHYVDTMGLSPEAIGMYWTICLKQLSDRRSVARSDLNHLIWARKQKIERILAELIKCNRIECDGDSISVPWCATEIEKLFTRPPRVWWNELRNEVFERDNYTCTYCGQIGGELEWDHIIPASRGGHAILENLTTACKPCNREKRNLTPEEWN